MKKVFIVLLLVVAVGCAKKHVVKAPEDTMEPADETTITGVEDVEDQVYMGDAEGEIVSDEGEIVSDTETLTEGMAIGSDVLFDYDRYDIKPDARPVLESLASWMKTSGGAKVTIEGHCDERGTNEYNLALGEKRAKAARDYLISLGISSVRINFITYGEERPVCTERDEDCWQLNRRAHFVVAE
jgi:peptidoglycan-associated lipoprotein